LKVIFLRPRDCAAWQVVTIMGMWDRIKFSMYALTCKN
jgi:hypothetical protein